MLKNMIGKQTIHYIFDIPEWCVNIREEHGDVIGSQTRSNSAGDVTEDHCKVIRHVVTHLADTCAAAASSSGVKGTMGGLRRCKRLGEGNRGGTISIWPDVLADGMGCVLGVGADGGERGGGSWH